MDKWYTRPVLFVADIERALRVYIDSFGFVQQWKHEADGRTIVTQVARGDSEIILALDAKRAGGARLFVSLTAEEMNRWQAEIAERAIPSQRGWWGYPVIEVRDADGNELLFPLDESGDTA